MTHEFDHLGEMPTAKWRQEAIRAVADKQRSKRSCRVLWARYRALQGRCDDLERELAKAATQVDVLTEALCQRRGTVPRVSEEID